MDNIANFITELSKYFITLMPQVLDGLIETLKLFIVTLVLSLPLGIIVAIGRLSKNKIINKITNLYITIMRGTPLLLQIVFVFFDLPLLGIVFDRFTAAIIAFTLNYAAYFGEIFRAGIASIDEGQYEGAEVLGLSKKDIFFRIILPQALKRVIPPVGNEVITLVKDTALVYIIGIDELLKVGKNAVNRDANLMPLIVIGIVYIILTWTLSKIMNNIENKYSYYR